MNRMKFYTPEGQLKILTITQNKDLWGKVYITRTQAYRFALKMGWTGKAPPK